MNKNNSTGLDFIIASKPVTVYVKDVFLTNRLPCNRRYLVIEPPKILVVDDEALIVMLIEKTLESSGYNIVTAGDGIEALEKVEDEGPDLIILDVMMPKMNGLEVCRRLKNNDKTRPIPVVMLTSKDYIEDKITGFETGADDYITKPFNPKEFQARIKSLMERNLYQHKRAENEKQQALEKMVEGIAHEVRNPIVSIGGFARRIRNKLSPNDRLHTYADHIIQEVERLETMVNQIVNLKTVIVNLEESVIITDILIAALAVFKNEISAKAIRVTKELPCGLPAIQGDRYHLHDAFCSIIQNAIEALDMHGDLHLAVRAENQTLIIEIKDTGCGISRAELGQITRPFYTSKMSGAGMGLTLVKHILLLHGGELSINSNPGQGTMVAITLPADDIIKYQ